MSAVPMAKATGSLGKTRTLKVCRQFECIKLHQFKTTFTTQHVGKEEDWLGARNFCRQRCMDLVSVETSPENEWIKQRIVDGKVSNS